ncbi:MAG: lipopolysaccharide biosynthesis protein [Bacteroidales bacterium]|jgi:O-antigen/teichoic acid export membrane protein|nr:lipopolysaccharide biosynthesis protein [Bacteroidales bacterium]
MQQQNNQPSSLKSKTVKGVGWSAIDAFVGQGVTFVVGLVLARLLSPSEFGLIGIATIFITILSGFVDCGFSNALIRKKEVSNNDYNTMFITNMAMSVLVFLILFFSAPLIADFFERQEVTNLLRVLALTVVIQAVSLVQNTILTKRIDFKTKTKATIIAAIISGTVGIGFAFAGFGVWALAAQQITSHVVNTICLCVFNNWLPNLSFNGESFRYMWGYGWKLMLSGFLDRTWGQLYQSVVGKCYAPETLGQYSRSKLFAQIFSQNFTMIIQRVTYPALAEVQDEKQRMIAAYRKIIKMSMFVTAVCMISLGAVSEPFIYCLIGDQWHQAATFLPLICISMSLYPLHAINLDMLQVQGRSDIFLELEIVKKIIAIGPICLGIFIGIYWMLVGSIVTGVIAFFLNSYYTGKNLGYSSWQQLKDIAPSYVIALIIAVSVYFFKFFPISNFIILPIQIIVGVMVLVAIGEISKTEEYVEIKGLAVASVRKIRMK